MYGSHTRKPHYDQKYSCQYIYIYRMSRHKKPVTRPLTTELINIVHLQCFPNYFVADMTGWRVAVVLS